MNLRDTEGISSQPIIRMNLEDKEGISSQPIIRMNLPDKEGISSQPIIRTECDQVTRLDAFHDSSISFLC